MKHNIHLFFSGFLLIGLLLFGFESFAQKADVKQIDSILKLSSAEMYKNPDKVIATGKHLLKETGNDIDLKISVYKLISDGYSSKRDYQKSLEYVMKANELLPQTKNKRLKISIVTKTGIQYHQLKIYDKAIQFLDQAEKLCLEYSSPDSVQVSLGINYIVRGFIYKEKLNCAIAINFFDRGIDVILKSKDVKGSANLLSIAKYNKGNCYLMMSNGAAARKSFMESIAYAKMIKANSLLAFAEKGLAQVYTFEGKYNEAISLLHEAHTISSDVNDLILNQEVYKGLSENYLAVNDWNNYKKYHLKFLEIQNVVMERERKSASDALDAIEKGNDNKFNKEIPGYLYRIIIVVLILLLLMFFFLFSASKAKRNIVVLKDTIRNLQGEKMLQDHK